MSFKKSFIPFFAVCLLFSTGLAQAQLRVFACEPEWAALATELGGDKVTVYSATTSLQDPHHIQPRPSLIAKARRADLLVCSGSDLEVDWLPMLLRKSANGQIQLGQQGYFMATEQVPLLEKPEILDRSLGDLHAAGNPHVQLDPERLLTIAEKLSQRLVVLDKGNETTYRKNWLRFSGQWKKSIELWRKQAKKLAGKRVVVHHNNWVYLERWLGLERSAELEPKPGVPPSSHHLSKLLNQLEQQPAEVILVSGYQPLRAANWLSDKTGMPVVVLPVSPSGDETLRQWFDRLLVQLNGSVQ